MGFHVADIGEVSTGQKFRHLHRGQSRPGTRQRLYYRHLQRLWDKFTDEFDNIELLDKNSKTYFLRTNLKGCKGAQCGYIWNPKVASSSSQHVPLYQYGKNINNNYKEARTTQEQEESKSVRRWPTGWKASVRG